MGRSQGKDPGEIKGDIDKFVWQEFFLLHEEIRSILMDRLHLIEGTKLAPSFEKYLDHATIEKVRNRLFHERDISTASVPPILWNNEFPEDVKTELDAAMRRYETYLSEIKPQLGQNDGRRAG